MIERYDDFKKGKAVISGTRFTVYDIIDCIKRGYNHEEILSIFTLTNNMIIESMSYYLENKEEIDNDISEECS